VSGKSVMVVIGSVPSSSEEKGNNCSLDTIEVGTVRTGNASKLLKATGDVVELLVAWNIVSSLVWHCLTMSTSRSFSFSSSGCVSCSMTVSSVRRTRRGSSRRENSWNRMVFDSFASPIQGWYSISGLI
jgi:hypothetical protein